MHRNVVELDDAVAVILLMESSVASCTHNSDNSLCGDPTSSFPDDNQADIDFLFLKVKVLEKYKMQGYLTAKERTILEKEQKRLMCDTELSWDNIEFDYNEAVTSTPASQKIDHYGRFTQKTSPSPSRDFNAQRYNFNQNEQVEFPITFPQENPRPSSSHKKRKNYSAD